MELDKHYINQIEVVTNIFSVIDDKVKVLLFKKMEEPFKGYWMLPSNLLMTSETIEECAEATIYEFIGIKNLYMKQSDIFSKIDRLPGMRILANSLICLIDYDNYSYNKNSKIESSWFDIDEVPKMIYDHGSILSAAISNLRTLLPNDYNMMKILYPKDFTLPELQITYEHLLGRKLDRRNFRKKLIHLDILEDTMDKNNKTNGRPAKLYCFKEDLERSIF